MLLQLFSLVYSGCGPRGSPRGVKVNLKPVSDG